MSSVLACVTSCPMSSAALLGGDRSAPVADGRGTSGDARTRPSTINNLKLKSSFVVLSKPGDGMRHSPTTCEARLESPPVNLLTSGIAPPIACRRASLPQSDSQPYSTGGNSHPLPNIMPSQASKPCVSMLRHKSTTDLPYSPQRGYVRDQRPSICATTEAELAMMRCCFLREANVRPCCRHALSFPSMASQCTSPLCSTPVRERGSESAQTTTSPPDFCKQCRSVSKDGKCRVDFAYMVSLCLMMCYAVTWFIFAGLYSLNAFLRGDLEVPADTDVETPRTIGYGARTVSPSCYGDVLLVMAQSIVGSMIDALMVGCMFGRISCPKKRAEILLFSRTSTVMTVSAL
ncbi:unnamed protein product [Leuciscus chuanchicus]